MQTVSYPGVAFEPKAASVAERLAESTALLAKMRSGIPRAIPDAILLDTSGNGRTAPMVPLSQLLDRHIRANNDALAAAKVTP